MNTLAQKSYRWLSVAQYAFFIYGILWLGWSVLFVIFALWIESVINFIFTFIKLSTLSCTEKPSVLLRFAFSFSFIIVIHGIFILVVALMLGKTDPFFTQFLVSVTNVADPKFLPIIHSFRNQFYNVFLIIALRYAAQHIMDFMYLRKQHIGWCRNIPITYKSVIYVHFFIIAGAFVAGYLGAPQYFAVVFILLKILFDWFNVGAKAFKMGAVIN